MVDVACHALFVGELLDCLLDDVGLRVDKLADILDHIRLQLLWNHLQRHFTTFSLTILI